MNCCLQATSQELTVPGRSRSHNTADTESALYPSVILNTLSEAAQALSGLTTLGGKHQDSPTIRPVS